MRPRRHVSAAIVLVSILAVLALSGCETNVQAGGPLPAPTLPPFKTATGPAPTSDTLSRNGSNNWEFDWKEGPNFTMAEWWTDPSRAGCAYATHPWPQAALSASRAYVLAARQVLRDEWNINSWVAQHGGATSEARIHGSETGCANAHLDYPPHVHIFYLARDPHGKWLHINTHDYLATDGRINDVFIIANLCDQNKSYHPAVNDWVDVLTEKCEVAWQQRYTPNGDLELRRDANAPIYSLRLAGIEGDRSAVEVLRDGQIIAAVEITQYDSNELRMTARINDYQKHRQITESWRGDPATGGEMASHSAQSAALNDPAPPPVTPIAAAPPTAVPDTPTPAPSPTPRPTLPASVTTTSVTLAITSPGDNVSQNGASLSGDSKSLWIGDSSDPTASYTGLRFAGAQVPQGKRVYSATLELYAPAAATTKIKVDIRGDASGNSTAFGLDSPPGQRNLTTAGVSYADPPPWAANTWYSIDVTPVVQEIIARDDWQTGSALSLIIRGVSGQAGHRREVKALASWDKANAPRLIISYY